MIIHWIRGYLSDKRTASFRKRCWGITVAKNSGQTHPEIRHLAGHRPPFPTNPQLRQHPPEQKEMSREDRAEFRERIAYQRISTWIL